LTAIVVSALNVLIRRRPSVFTASQLDALSGGDEFHGADTREVFGVCQTPFGDAMRESYCDPKYSRVVLQR
jgi:hypothetical protein